MCDDCRIEAQYAVGGPQPMASAARPAVRTTQDYLDDRRIASDAPAKGRLKVDDFLN